MLKAVMTKGDGTKLILLGLEEQNIQRLKEGQPIHVEGEDIGFPGIQIGIMYGETQQHMIDELKEVRRRTTHRPCAGGETGRGRRLPARGEEALIQLPLAGKTPMRTEIEKAVAAVNKHNELTNAQFDEIVEVECGVPNDDTDLIEALMADGWHYLQFGTTWNDDVRYLRNV
jgi:hypothetical protein